MKPVCPHCKTELKPFRFEGYYDSFSGWFCKCKKIPKSVKMSGTYSGSLDPHYEEVMETQ
jgi:transposase-like protein